MKARAFGFGERGLLPACRDEELTLLRTRNLNEETQNDESKKVYDANVTLGSNLHGDEPEQKVTVFKLEKVFIPWNGSSNSRTVKMNISLIQCRTVLLAYGKI